MSAIAGDATKGEKILSFLESIKLGKDKGKFFKKEKVQLDFDFIKCKQKKKS